MNQSMPSSPIDELYVAILAAPLDRETKDRLGALWMAASNQYEARCRELKELCAQLAAKNGTEPETAQ